MNDEFDENSAPELTADEEALLQEMPALEDVGVTRRRFLKQMIAGSLGVFALDLLAHEEALAALSPAPEAVFADRAVENLVKVALKVNGATKRLEIDSRACPATRLSKTRTSCCVTSHTSARRHFARFSTNSDARDPPWSHRVIAKATASWEFPPSSHLRDLQRSLNSAEGSAPNN